MNLDITIDALMTDLNDQSQLYFVSPFVTNVFLSDMITRLGNLETDYQNLLTARLADEALNPYAVGAAVFDPVPLDDPTILFRVDEYQVMEVLNSTQVLAECITSLEPSIVGSIVTLEVANIFSSDANARADMAAKYAAS